MAGRTRNTRRSRPRRQSASKARPKPRKTARAKARPKPTRTRKAPAKRRRRTVARKQAPKRLRRAKATLKAATRRPKRPQQVAKIKSRKVVAAPARPKAMRPRTTERPALDRSRRVLPDEERLEIGAAAARAEAAQDQDRMLSAARAGHNELRSELGRHTEASPALTAGDVDARWQDAYAVGDEAPGGDNPTPDQDRVDDIGKALGIQYQDDQELQGGDEVTERDKHRWELDPASSDDWPHDKK